MKLDEFWKNFKLGAELDIAGRFIYNGLKVFDEMENFYLEEDAFEFLYNISVGIERLLKIWIILSEHDQFENQEKFEKSLKTHDHEWLMRRVLQNRKYNLTESHRKLLSLLSKFYKSYRYDRYVLSSITIKDKDKDGLINFIESELGIVIDAEFSFMVTRNDIKIKKFIGRVIGEISEICYSGISREASKLNLYTYEVPVYSKAYKIFISKEYNFERERTLVKEFIVYLLSNKLNHGVNVKFLSEMEPLDFDPADESEYLQALHSDLKKLHHTDELEELYIEDDEKLAKRRMQLEVGFNKLYLSDEEE